MICSHSLGRAARYYPEQTGTAAAGKRTTLRELQYRVGGVAASLRRYGFEAVVAFYPSARLASRRRVACRREIGATKDSNFTRTRQSV